MTRPSPALPWRLLVAAFAWLVTPVLLGMMRVLLRRGGLPDGERWTRLEVAVDPASYGASAPGDFADYLRGDSGVAPRDLEAIEAWLRACEYVIAPGRADDWAAQPVEFEERRRGNCLDHALWAWRQLLRLGHDAELVVGWWRRHDASTRHAWVIVRGPGAPRLVEATAKDGAPMVLPLDAIPPEEYWPETGVGAGGERFSYIGLVPKLIRTFDELREGRRELGLAWVLRGDAVREEAGD